MKTLKPILLTILTFTTSIYAYGQNDLGKIPAKVKQTADSIINSTLGTDYLNKTTFDCESSLIHVTNPDHFILNDCRPPEAINKKKKNKKKGGSDLKMDSYALKYQLTLMPNSNYKFEIWIDETFKLNREVNLPNCLNTKACDIKVDSLAAVDLAIKSGLEKGLGIYNEGLTYDNETQTFQWKIKNHLKQAPDKGELIYIDAVTGQRISNKDEQWVRSVVH